MSMRQDIEAVLSQTGPNQAPIDTPDVRDLLRYADAKGVRLVWLHDDEGKWAVSAMWRNRTGGYTSILPIENPVEMLNALKPAFTEH